MVKKPRILKKPKQDSIFLQMWDVWVERQRTRKAVRMLKEQDWSVEFLTQLLIRAARMQKQHLSMTISRGALSFTVTTVDPPSTTLKDDSIFDHLDDDLRIKQFMESVR